MLLITVPYVRKNKKLRETKALLKFMNCSNKHFKLICLAKNDITWLKTASLKGKEERERVKSVSGLTSKTCKI